MSRRIIIGIHISNRVDEVPDVQGILTTFGCNIRTRLGLHQLSGEFCSTAGLLLLEMCGDEAKIDEMDNMLNALEGVTTQRMVFEE